MANIYLVQLIGVILIIAGLIALTASAHIFGTRLSPVEKQRASDEWNRRRDRYRLPISPDAIVASLLFFGGIGILNWSEFSLCAFLTFWIPSLPQTVRLFLSCT